MEHLKINYIHSMKYLLLLLFPIFVQAQDVKIGYRDESGWVFDYNLPLIASEQLDTVGNVAANYTSVYKENDTVLMLTGMRGTTKIIDNIFVKTISDTIYTDYLQVGCATHCAASDCLDCDKTASCGCMCTSGEGLCDERNYGVEMPMSLSRLICRYLILLNNNNLPE